ASTSASQTQMLVATTSPSLAPSRNESCLPDRATVAIIISPPRPGRMHSALGEDLRDAREGLTGRVGDVAPAVGSRPAQPVVERLGAPPERLPHNDPTHHPHGFVPWRAGPGAAATRTTGSRGSAARPRPDGPR